MVTSLKIALAAGGTGGHLFPALALGEFMQRNGHQAWFVTERRGASFLGADPLLPVKMVESGTLSGGGVLGKIKGLLGLLRGVWQARALFKKERPDVVVGFGGYPALPGTLAAAMLGIPVVLHEQNALFGRANKLLAGRAAWIATSLPHMKGIEGRDFDRVILTGNPVRREVGALAASEPEDFAVTPMQILVTGGSLGATILSEIVPPALGQLPGVIKNRLVVTHQARPADHDAVVAQYQRAGIRANVVPFIDDMALQLQRSILVICRAGASTVAELAVIGRPAILVPLPTALDDHQTVNAKLLSDLGGGWLMPQATFSVDSLAAQLISLFGDDGVQLKRAAELAQRAGKPDATERLALVTEAAAQGAALPAALKEFERIGV